MSNITELSSRTRFGIFQQCHPALDAGSRYWIPAFAESDSAFAGMTGKMLNQVQHDTYTRFKMYDVVLR